MTTENKSYIPILSVLCISSFLVPFTSTALNLALPDINTDLDLTATTSGWVQTIYLLSTAIFQIPCARLADIYGRKKFFFWGSVIFMLFSVLCGFSPSGFQLLTCRFLCGIGSAMVFSTGMAILTAAIPKEKRGWAMGINVSVVYLSAAAGPFFGGLLTQQFGWQSIFFLVAGVNVVVLIGVLLFIKQEWKENISRTFDYIGSALYALGLTAIIYGFSQLSHAWGIMLVLFGLKVMVVFAKYEKRIPNPVFNINTILRNRVFRFSSLSAFINYSATSAIAFMLSLYLQYIRGLSPHDAGLILLVQALTQAFVSPLAGRLSDRVSASKLASLGMLIISAGLILFCFLSETTNFNFIIGILILIGIGFGIFSSPNTNTLMSSVNKKDYSMASATVGTMRLAGQSMSMGIAVMAISFMVGNVPITPHVHEGLMSSIVLTFTILAVLCIAGVYTSSIGRKRRSK